MSKLTHFDEKGMPKMVDVSGKELSLRTATAESKVYLNEETARVVSEGKMKKGDVLKVAQVAGIMAAKRCSDLIPMCHPIAITGVEMSLELDESVVSITASVRCKGETGVEMEAMTAVSVAALTVYDMCKAMQRDIVIGETQLLYKDGGKSGEYRR